MEVPTLLIGLGGLGSHIVDEIYHRIPINKRSRVAIHVFDTNINDIKKLRYLTEENITQTSAAKTVGQYLNDTDASVKEWFPYEVHELKRKSLTDGAGQVRAVSRLAYRAAIEDRKLDKFEAAVNKIFRVSDKDLSASPRVMIVCSLAGGTGAGMFLQTALFVRDILANNFGRQNVLIRGAFMLPDTLVGTKTIKGNQVENIRANGYACMKELNAITRNATMATGNGHRMTIELEYKPNQVDSEGRLMHNLQTHHLPFDFVFLYDFENSRNENLMYFDNYIDQVIRSTYLDLFSPISGDRFSKQDNQIIDLVENDGLSRYCGSGVATLTYPYHEIIDFAALKWVTSSLSNDWLELDKHFEDVIKEYEKALERGEYREAPHRGKEYVAELNRLGNGENPKPFFVLAYKDAFTVAEKGRIGEPKSELFLGEIERTIEDIISMDEELSEKLDECYLDPRRLTDRDNAVKEVVKMEDALSDYQMQMTTTINSVKSSLIKKILVADEDEPKMVSGDSYKLNTWILKKRKPVHPVTVRYILYQVQIELEKRLQEMTPQNDQLYEGIKKYKKIYDLPDTEDYEEGAEDRIRMAMEQSILGRIFKNELKAFAEEYEESALSQLNKLKKYTIGKLTQDIFEGVLSGVVQLLDELERYFENLKEIRNSLKRELIRVSTAHNNDKLSNPTKIYVLASQEIKEARWEEISSRYVGVEMPENILEEIYKSHYARFCKRFKQVYVADEKIEKIETMFRKDVLNWCKQELALEDRLNVNVIRALEIEAQMMKKGEEEIDQYVRDQVSKLNNLANPLVPQPRSSDRSEFNAWGIHPDCIASMSEGLRNEVFSQTELVDSEAFSPYEIERNKTIFGLKIDDFNKFYCGDVEKNIPPGSTYTAYQDRIRQLINKGNTITPHLDKRWHIPYYLPDINQEKESLVNENIDKAFLLGLMFGYLQNTERHNTTTWEFFGEEDNRFVPVESGYAGKYVHELHHALGLNPQITDGVLARVRKQMEIDRQLHRDVVKNYHFVKVSRKITYIAEGEDVNILDIILRYSHGNPADSNLETTGRTLIKKLGAELQDLFLQIFGKERSALALEELIKFFKKLQTGSAIYKSMDKTHTFYKQVEQMLAKLEQEAALK